VADVDPPRLLALYSELGYTDRIDRALPDEPEAVSAAEQQRQTQLARRTWARRRQDAFRECDQAVGGALDALLTTVGPDRQIASGARAVRRTMQALGRRIESVS
jgi:hypothetical protein